MFARLCGTIAAAVLGVALSVVPGRAAGDIETKAQLCVACHGQAGIPTDPKTIPVIWGQQASYLVKQLHDYRSGDRESPIMSPIAKSLDQDDLRKMAAYFAAKAWPSQIAPPATPTRVKAVASRKPDATLKALAQCQLCHQPNFEGGLPAPRLAGLSYEYLAAEMHKFARHERTNNGDMPQFMARSSAKEREAMARYIAGLR